VAEAKPEEKPAEEKKEEKPEEKPAEEKKEEPKPPSPCVLFVDLHCVGCAKKIERYIMKMRGSNLLQALSFCHEMSFIRVHSLFSFVFIFNRS